MRALVAIVRQEWRLQLRSLRVRFGLLVYLAANAAPVMLVLARERRSGITLPGSASLELLAQVAPFLAAVWAVVVVGGTARVPGEAQVLLGAPMRSAVWVLGKCGALLSLVVSTSLLAFGGTLALSRAMGGGAVPWSNAMLRWAVEVAPLAVLAGVGFFGLLRMLHSEVLALIAGVGAVPAAGLLVNQVLALVGMRVVVAEWSGFPEATLLVAALSRGGRPWWTASDSAWDWRTAIEQTAPGIALPAAVAVACLGLAVAYVGRCRPEHAPRPVSGDHPLRNFLRGYGRLRRRLRSDADLDLVDRAVRASAVLMGLGVLAWLVGRGVAWERVAGERYRVEVAEIGTTTPRSVTLERVRVVGSLERDGTVDVAVESTLRNDGVDAGGHLAFHLDRGLALEGLEALDPRTGDAMAVAPSRGWDRVELELDPPIAPGSRVRLEYRLRGRPGVDSLYMKRIASETFATSWERHRDAARASDLSPFAGSWRVRSVTPGRVRLAASDLLLAPRWDPWTLTPDRGPGAGGRRVLADTFAPPFELSVELELPSGWLLVDGCGVLSAADAGGRPRHRSSCEVTIPTVALLGGRREAVGASSGAARVAALPGHRRYVDEVLEAMARTVELSDRAWPGLEALDAVAAVEMPREPSASPSLRPEEPELVGRLIVVPESLIRYQELLAAPELVASLLTQEIEPARPIAPGQEHAVDALLRAILLRRMGLGASSGWMWPKPHLQWRLRFPLRSATPYDAMSWQVEMPALLHSLEAQLGSSALLEGARAFVEAADAESDGGGLDGDQPVGVRDLLVSIGRAGDGDAADGEAVAWLERVYEDFFVKGPVPELALRDVESRRAGHAWRVTATLRNVGGGQARCPLVVRSDVEEVERWVVVEAKDRVEVSFELPSRPHTLVLDPGRECFLLRDPSRPRNQRTLSSSERAGAAS